MQNDKTTVGFPLLKAVTGTGASVEFQNVYTDATPRIGLKSKIGVSVKLTGAPTAVTVIIEGSINGVDWASLATHIFSADELSDAFTVFHIADKPIAYIRGNLGKLTGGTNPTVTVDALASE